MDKDIIGKIIIWIEAHPATVGLIATMILAFKAPYFLSLLSEKKKEKKEKAEQKILLEKHKKNLLIIYDELLVCFNHHEELRNRKSNISSEQPIYKQKFAQYLPQLLLELYNPIDSKFYNKLFIFLGILNENQNEFNIPFNSPKDTYKYLHQIIQEINNNEYDHSIIKFIQNNTKNID